MGATKLTRFWHGGAPGLRPGDRVLPADKRPITAIHRLDPDIYPGDPSRVYVTTDRRHARSFATLYFGQHQTFGDLYNVKPIGDLEPDPDMDAQPGVGWMCRAARVIAVVERGVRMSETDMSKAQAPYLCWSDGSPVYDAEGWAQPSPEHRAIGVTADDMRNQGRWAAFAIIQTWPPVVDAHRQDS